MYNYNKELKAPFCTGHIELEGSFVFKLAFRLLNLQAKNFKMEEPLERTKFSVDTYDGVSIPCYMVRPKTTQEKLSTIIYYHGGGFYGPLQVMMMQNAAYFAEQLHCNVILPEYRLAPKYPFPTPMEDSYSTLLYIFEHAEELNVDKNRMILYGDSAGGCLAAAVTHLIRDRKGPKVLGQMLIYPVTDHTMNHKSMLEYKDAAWSAYSNRQMWGMYLRNGSQGMIRYAAPLNGDDFSDLPQAYIEPQEIDTLRDEGIAYAEKLLLAGIPIDLNVIEGSYHGFDTDLKNPFILKVVHHRCEVMRKMLDGSFQGERK